MAGDSNTMDTPSATGAIAPTLYDVTYLQYRNAAGLGLIGGFFIDRIGH